MHERTKQLQIPKRVKEEVFERDGEVCVLCGSWRGLPNAHFVARSHGGRGIKTNILTLCPSCHAKYDNSEERKAIREDLRNYLISKYPEWKEEDQYYKKGETK